MKLYAYGSSFTQGMELCDGDDSDQYKIADKTTWLKDYKYTSEILECERSLSWPNQLADMLGIECENKARSGNSEFGMIHNYTIDLSNDVFDEDDIVIEVSFSRNGQKLKQQAVERLGITPSLFFECENERYYED